MPPQAIAEVESAPPTDQLELGMTLAMALNKLPPLSPLVSRVLALRNDPDAGVAELAKVVSSDPILSARLIGMANSAHFASVHPMVRIQDAVMRLGFSTACDVAVSAAVSRSLPTPAEFKPLRRDLWLHSFGIALAAREFAKRMGADCDPDTAYLTGFLHDIGYLAIVALWPDMARALLAQATDPARWENPDIVRERKWPTHGAIGGELCKLWRLPDEICVAVWDHDTLRDESEEGDGAEEGDGGSTITALDGAIALAHRALDGVLPLKHEVVWRPALPLSAVLRVTELRPAVVDEVRLLMEKQAERMAGVAENV